LNDDNILATQYAVTKRSEIYSPAVKKGCSPKKAIVENDVKSKVVAKKWRLMAKFLITTIHVNFVPNPSETWRRQHKLVHLRGG